MKNLITGHFPSASTADPDIFYFNFNTRVGRVYKNGGAVNYEAWIANEGTFPYVDSDGNGTLDIREPKLLHTGRCWLHRWKHIYTSFL